MDEFIDGLLREERVIDIQLPRYIHVFVHLLCLSTGTGIILLVVFPILMCLIWTRNLLKISAGIRIRIHAISVLWLFKKKDWIFQTLFFSYYEPPLGKADFE
jgi:hypothetical protein